MFFGRPYQGEQQTQHFHCMLTVNSCQMRIVRAFAELFECSDFKQLWICFSHTFSCVTHKKNDAATWNCNLKNEKTKQCIYIDALCLEYGEHMSIRGNLRCMHVSHDNGFLFCLEPTPNESVFVLPLTLSRLSYLSCLSLSLFLCMEIIIFISGSQFILVEVFTAFTDS